MRLLYTLGIRLYAFMLRVASIWNTKARYRIEGCKDLFDDLAKWRKIETSDVLWFHAASLGEFEQGRPLMEAVRQKYPNYKILLTFFSPSGYEVRKNYKGADKVCYLPLDTPYNAKIFVEIVKPAMVFFIKYEYWYNYLKVLKEQSVPVFYISAKFRPQQYFFKWYAKWFVAQLQSVNCFFVQDEESECLLESIGIERVCRSGDTRFDRVLQIQDSSISYPWLSKFKGDACLLIGGSTWLEDELILAACFPLYQTKLKYLLVPHEIDHSHISKIKNLFEAFHCATLSEMEAKEFAHIEDVQILIVDKIGLLSQLYKYGDIAFIGGGFGKGIHNILEAAVFGMPILFGPQYAKFKEAFALIEKKAAYSVNGKLDVSLHLDEWISKSEAWEFAAVASKDYVIENKGALTCILKEIDSYFKSNLSTKV